MLEKFRSAYIFPIIIALTTLAVLIPNLPPGLTFVDCGQLCTAAWGLGIPHPSGYPLWCLWVRLGIGATAGLDATVWAAFASALMLAITSGLLTRLGIKLATAWGWDLPWAVTVGISAAIIAISARVVLEQSTVAEVYSLNMCFLAMLMLLSLSPQNNYPKTLLFALTAGLGLANHSSLILPLIPLSVFILRGSVTFKKSSLLLLAFILGLSVWLYLPLRSHAVPAVSWGWPDRLDRFWEHATRAIYGGPQFGRLPFFLSHLGRMFAAIPAQLGWQMLVFPSMGLGYFWIKQRSSAWLLLWLLIVTGPLSVFFLTLLLQPHQVSEFLTWLAPFYLLLGFLAGWGVVLVTKWLVSLIKHKYAMPVGIIAALALSSSIIVSNLPEVSKCGYYFAEDYGHNLLSTLSFRSIYVLQLRGSLGAFESAYLVKVRQLRPDYRIVDTTASVFSDRSYYETYHSLPPNLQEQWRLDNERKALQSGLSCYYNFYSLMPQGLGLKMVYDGMLFRAVPMDEKNTDNLTPFEYYQCRGLTSIHYDDDWAVEAGAQYQTHRGVILWKMGRHEEGFVYLRDAERIAQGAAWPLAAIGEGYIYIGEWERAANLFSQAVEALLPEVVNSTEFSYDVGGMYLNLAYALQISGDESGANRAFNKVRQICPQLLK